MGLYGLYKKWESNPVVANVSSFAYSRVLYGLRGSAAQAPPTNVDSALPTIAFVCDDMTWEDYSPECRAVYVTPKNWRSVFARYKPDILLCESAWRGVSAYPDAWRGKLYKNSRLWYNNRRDIQSIVEYCRQNNIHAVFWNKEDPRYFGDAQHDFSDTALSFGTVLTTAAECVPRYEELGAKNVHTWMFGFAPHLYYPPPHYTLRENTAVFAGSWYGDVPDRCADMRQLFDTVLSAGVGLTIYDRNYGTDNAMQQYPAQYRPYIRPAVLFSQLGDIYRKARYVINVNTVMDSETMFARRVFEAMACGNVVISNASPGLERLFPGGIWYPGHPFDRDRAGEMALKNQQTVIAQHSCAARMQELYKLLGMDGNNG